MDSFEKHIRNNKEFFDENIPNRLNMWEDIEKELHKREHVTDQESKLGSRTIWLLLLLLAIIGTLIGTNQQTKKNQSRILMAESYKELNAIDQHYTQLVSYQINKLKSSDKLSEQEKEDFLEYINELTAEQHKLKVTLKKNINNEEVIEAIIENFSQQIKLLEQLLERVNTKNLLEDETGIYI